jgi:hypothetical protein
MSTATPTVAAIPPPDKLKAELVELYRVVRYTRTLLKLSERIHNATPLNTKPEGSAHAAAR